MTRADVAVWGGLLAAGLLFEWRELREGDAGVPLTRVIRSVFRTHSPAGRLAFRAVVVAGSDLLVRHILASPGSAGR